MGGSLLISISFHTALEREQESAYSAYQMVVGTLQIVNSVNGQSNYGDLSHTLDQLTQQNTGTWTALRLHTATRNIFTTGTASSSGPVQPGACTIRYVSTPAGGRVLALSGAIDAGAEVLYLDMSRDVSPSSRPAGRSSRPTIGSLR